MKGLNYLTTVWLFFISFHLSAQMPSAEERSVQVSAEVSAVPPQIQLTWKEDSGASQYRIYRKAPEAQNWGEPLTTLTGNATTFTDSDVQIGVAYEYALFKEDFAPRVDTICVPAGTEMNFTITDMYNIGLCCSFGLGNYEVRNCGNIVASGTDFGTSASHSFTACNEGADCSDVIISIKTDMFENSTSWVLNNAGTGEEIANSGAVGSFIKPRPEYGFIYAGIDLPAIEQRGKVLLLTEASLSTPLAGEIAQLELDLIGDGWQVLQHSFAADDAPLSVRSYIQSLYAQQEDLQAVYLLGRIPIAFSGDIFPDTHFEYRGAYPADVFYGELDGTWTDETVNNTAAVFDIYHNSPGDGKFDQGVIPTGQVELSVGRVDFREMSAFDEDETELTRRYLEKSHAFKTKQFNPRRRGLIDDNFGQSFAAPAASGYRNFAPMFGADSIFQADYFTSMAEESYLWSYGCGSGSIISASGVGSTSDFAASDLQTVFTMLFGSQFGNWAYSNDFLRAPLASGQTLTNVWAGNPPWTFHHMAMGHPIGFSTLKTQNESSDLYLGNGTQLVHVALMGDPTLRMHMVEPVSDLLITPGNTDIQLNWTAPQNEDFLGYYIYRASSLQGQFTRLNAEPVTESSFTDTNPLTGENWYMVRTLKSETSGSGTYFNLSLGLIDSVFFEATVPLLADFTADTQEICEGEAVQYTDNSTGGITSYNWTFAGGNPASSTLANPQVVYENAGSFAVSLSVGDGNSSSETSQQDFLTVSSLPSPDFTFTVIENEVQISDNSTGGTTYLWDFGDNNSSNSPGNISHTYAESGTYTITLNLSNECGSESLSTTVVINTTSTSNFLPGKLISLYPNPAQSILNVETQGNFSGKAEVQIVNILQQSVWQKSLTQMPEILTLGVQDFPSGVYFLRLRLAGEEVVKRFVVE